jgi:hypothetical protein
VLINLSSCSGWIKFHDAQTPVAPIIVTLIMGVSLLYNLYTHRKWGEYLMADGSEDAQVSPHEVFWLVWVYTPAHTPAPNRPACMRGLQEAGHQLTQPPVGLPFDWYLPPLSGAGGEFGPRPVAAFVAGAPERAHAAENGTDEESVRPQPAVHGRQADGEQLQRGPSEPHASVLSCDSRSYRAAAAFRSNGIT